MRVKFFQEVIDFIRFKKIKPRLKEYLNERPILLKLFLNILGLFPNNGKEAKVELLRFCGAKIGKNVGVGNNVYIYRPKNLELGDYVGIGDNTVMRCWNKVSIDDYTFFAINSVLIPGSHNTYDYENIDNQEIKIGKGCWIGANCTVLGGGTSLTEV